MGEPIRMFIRLRKAQQQPEMTVTVSKNDVHQEKTLIICSNCKNEVKNTASSSFCRIYFNLMQTYPKAKTSADQLNNEVDDIRLWDLCLSEENDISTDWF